MTTALQSSTSRILTILLAASVLATPSHTTAQPPAAKPFTTSHELTPSTLAPERAEALSRLAQPRVNPQQLFHLRRTLCASTTRQPTLADDTPRMALATVKSGLATEIQFESSDTTSTSPSFSLYLQFNGDSVLLRRSNPRFSSETSGLAASYPKDVARPLWFEGTGDSSIFAFVPPIPGCAVEAVVLCPRKRAATAELAPTSYKVVAQTLTGSAVADGLYGPPAGVLGRLQASILGSRGVMLPTPWFVNRTGSGAPIASALATRPEADTNTTTGAPLSTPSLPSVSAIEARLEVGTESEVKRTLSSRSSVQISEITLAEQTKSVIGPTTYQVEPGRCYLVTAWTEKVL